MMLVTAMAGCGSLLSSCRLSRFVSYEDGMLDDGDISVEEAGDIFQLNSEIDNDDQERY